MKAINVVHHRTGCYSEWHAMEQVEPWLTRYWQDYFEGKRKPHYPVPAIRECPWCHSRHMGHTHWVAADGMLVPN